MALSFAAETIPLFAHPDGVVRVGNTRVTLDTVIAAFGVGATPEEIVQQYPTLNLADVYQVISYYLRHRSEVEAYLCRRMKIAESVRRENENAFDPEGIRDRLLARVTSREQ